jgi:ubiquinol-cytochrome c reductase cytochrome c subunit
VRGLAGRWLARRARTPRWLRATAALVLSTTALFGILAPPSSGAGQGTSSGTGRVTTPGPLTARGGPPSTSSNAPSKSPEPSGRDAPTTSFPNTRALRGEGMALYDNGCSGCHGFMLSGRAGQGPSLIGVGAGPVDFYLSTGRMPLQDPTDQPERAHPAYTSHQIDALIAFITTLGGGPAAPAADPADGNLSTGFQIFTENCAGCHQIVGRGGMTLGAFAPSLQHDTALQIAEAIRMGPYVMPHFDSSQINQSQLDSLVRYVIQTRHPDNAGGWGIYNIGPIPEGMAAWFIALLALVLVARLIGERTGGEIR